jgi:glycosyltransferase involved in cell wall biosynthesis
MTIHHIINDYNLALGGAQRLAIDLHKGSLDAGLSSKLFGLSNNPNYKIKGASSLEYKSPYKLIIPYKLWLYFKNEVRSGDIVHVHLFPTIFYVSILKIFRIIPKSILILTEHSTSNNRRGKWLGKIIDLITYTSYSNIIAVSEGTAKSLIVSYPFLSKKIQIINNGAHLFFKNAITRTPGGKVIILSVGRLHPSKNYETTIKALVPIRDLNFEYLIAGIGDLEEDLKAQVEHLGLQDKVKFVGYVSDIPSLLKQADIFLIPSKWEGFGLAAVEAMNASLPCIVSDVPGLGDLIIKDGEDAFLVAPSNEQRITERLRKLIENKELRHKMGEKAFTRSLNFGIDTMIEDYINLYEALSDE